MTDFAVFKLFYTITFQRSIDHRQVFDSKGCVRAIRPNVTPDLIPMKFLLWFMRVVSWYQVSFHL